MRKDNVKQCKRQNNRVLRQANLAEKHRDCPELIIINRLLKKMMVSKTKENAKLKIRSCCKCNCGMAIITKNENPDTLESIYRRSLNAQNLLRKLIPFAASCQYESEEERKCNLQAIRGLEYVLWENCVSLCRQVRLIVVKYY